MLIGSTSRFVGGRKAMRTVYWKMTRNGNKPSADEKIIKFGRTINFQNQAPDHVASVKFDDMKVRDKFDSTTV